MAEIQIDFTKYVLEEKEGDKSQFYPIINPDTKLRKGIIHFDSGKIPISSPELFLGVDGEAMVFPSQPMITEEGLIKPLKKADKLSNFSPTEQSDIVKADLIRREEEQKRNECYQKLRQQEPLRLVSVLTGYPAQNNTGIVIPTLAVPQCNYNNGKLILQDPENPQPEVLANFDLEPLKEVIKLQGENRIGGVVKAVIVFKDHRTEFSVNSCDVKNVLSYARKADIQCIVEYSPAKVTEKITNHFLSKLGNIPKEYVQTQAGWTSWKDRPIFSHDARKVGNGRELKFQTGISVLRKELSNTDIINIFYSILEIAPIKVIAPLIATALLGPLFQLFSSVGDEYRPSYVTFINGQSGSLKTAVAKVLFTMFNADNAKVPASFKDTATSMEIRLKESRSSVALIDDYYATGLSSVKYDMQKSLETIIRFVGDGTSRNRSNANLEDVKGTRPEGMVVITGEDTDGQLSTLLRCLVINVEKGIFNGKKLEIFQQDKLLWSTFLATFIDYVESYYLQIQELIKNNFCTGREHYKDYFSDLRQVDQMVQLHLTYRILEGFLVVLGGNAENIYNICENCIDGCAEAVKLSHEYAIENSAENQFPITVYNMIIKRELNIAATRQQYNCNVNSYDGFETEEDYVLDFERLYAKALAHYKRINKRFDLTKGACKSSLYKAGLLEVEYENRGTEKEKLLYEKKYKIGTLRIRLLTIKKESLCNFVTDKL